jgi:hypothetical protein
VDADLLDRARNDFPLFCELVGIKLFGWQLEFAEAVPGSRHLAACCGRRAGKSYLAGGLATWWAIRERDQQILIIGGTDDGAKRTLDQAAYICREHPWLGAAVDTEQRTSVRFGNGSRINSEPGRSEAAVRGYRRVDLEIWDESQLIPNTTYQAGRPAVGDRPDARVLAFGTPGGPADGWFRRLFERGIAEPGAYVRSFTVPSTANPNVTQQELDDERRQWGDAFVDQEYLAAWLDQAGLVWTRDQIYSCVVDVPPFTVEDAKRFSGWTDGWYGQRIRDRVYKCVMGLDFGKEIDAHSWVLISALGDHGMNGGYEPGGDPSQFGRAHHVYWVPDMAVRARTPYRDFVREVMGLAEGFGVQVLAAEVTGVGAGPVEELEYQSPRADYGFGAVCAVNASNRQKLGAVSRLSGLMYSRRFVIPAAHRDLIAQMSTFGKEVLPVSGQTRFAAVGGAHDDAVHALLMAIGCVRPQDRYPDESHTVFAPGPEDGFEFVETPNGIKVPLPARPEEYHLGSWQLHPAARRGW